MPAQTATRIDIARPNREKVEALLNQLLADLTDMAARTKHAHWNVTGPHFIALHQHFDGLHAVLTGHIDAVAERTAALGGFVRGRLSDAAGATRLKEFPEATRDGMAVVKALAGALADVSNAARDGIETCEDESDLVTADLLTGLSGDLDKQLYFLESHLR
ncbi:MAG: DNA starvation/stationary phase protection protein Dps [Rhodobacter sp.]|jgi:starvation-inducible DNA-binding protein|nr:DNA starvation/stationary phase protection protein Dps [Rhodobacter sp.]MBK8440653.1 DNA starvation/stationary phase protection protein Dps [Rhodobacter sp.]